MGPDYVLVTSKSSLSTLLCFNSVHFANIIKTKFIYYYQIEIVDRNSDINIESMIIKEIRKKKLLYFR